MGSLQKNPEGQKLLYPARLLRYKYFFFFFFFCEKFILAIPTFFENWDGYSQRWLLFIDILWIKKFKNFLKNPDDYYIKTPCGSKTLPKSFYLAQFSRYKHFCVLQFWRIIRKFKIADILARQLFLENPDGYSAAIPCGSKLSSTSLYQTRISRYRHFCVFLIWKIRND